MLGINQTAVQGVSLTKTSPALFACGNTDEGESQTFFSTSPSSELNWDPCCFQGPPHRHSALISVAAFGIRRPSGSQTKV